MIRIHRLDEAACCPDLARVRAAELERVRQVLDAGGVLSDELVGSRYDVARRPLFEMQHYKCCYCETKQNSHKWNTTEHFRPKAAVTRDEASHLGYWWLAWTWENLFFCCTQCNSYKHCHFPLDRGSTPLLTDEMPPGNEQPLLLDPCADAENDPRQHIQFLPVGDSWWPFPRNGSPRGAEFLERLRFYHPEVGVSRAGLVSKWRAHARSLRPAIDNMRRVLRTESDDVIRSTWEARMTPHLFCSQEFVALSIDVFDYEFDVELRDRYGLQLDPLPLPAPE